MGVEKTNLKLVYSLKHFTDSSDENFMQAVDVYRRTVARNVKTNTNEIVWAVDNRDKFKKVQLFFFGLELNGKIIGYAEIAFIKRTRYITIDYIVIEEKYRTHSAFYSFFMLIIEFFNTIGLDYDYIGVEILTNIDASLVEEIPELELEGFKVVNELYIQPSLEKNNFDSKQEAILMIYQRNSTASTISRESYCDIVNSIYFDYYYEWDCNISHDQEENGESYKELSDNYTKIAKNVLTSEILLNGYPFKKMSAEDKIIPSERSVNKKLWLSLFLIIAFFLTALIVMLAIKKLKIELIVVVVVLIIMTFLWMAIMYFFDDKAIKIIKNVPLLSKIFEHLK